MARRKGQNLAKSEWELRAQFPPVEQTLILELRVTLANRIRKSKTLRSVICGLAQQPAAFSDEQCFLGCRFPENCQSTIPLVFVIMCFIPACLSAATSQRALNLAILPLPCTFAHPSSNNPLEVCTPQHGQAVLRPRRGLQFMGVSFGKKTYENPLDTPQTFREPSNQ